MKLLEWTSKFSWSLVILGSLTLGLAPYYPQPHLLEKLGMLFSGALSRPIDIFDLFLHGFFPVLLVLKSVYKISSTKQT